MRKVIAAMNMTLDGFCDHTAGIADDELHVFFDQLLRNSDAILYGRRTYELMEYWRTVLENPTGNTAEDEFATAIDGISKTVFSRTLKTVDWKSARLAVRDFEEELRYIRNQPGGNILLGSPSMIVQGMKCQLIDEYQIVVHPVVLGSGLPLFKDIEKKVTLDLVDTKRFESGAVALRFTNTKQAE